MWKRSDLKKSAKEVIFKDYWKAFLVSLIASGLFINGFSYSRGVNHTGSGDFSQLFENGLHLDAAALIVVLLAVLAVAIVIGLIIGLLYIALMYPLSVGEARYYISAGGGIADMNFIAHAFKKDRYLNVLTVLFLRNIFVFLWTLLFIIPGIIKHYQYYMVKYIVADNSKIDYKRALEISKQMTRGNKWNIFVLELSFLGWYLLGLLPFGLGIYFVNPYFEATKAELYLHLRNEALSQAAIHPEEFSLTLQLPPGEVESSDTEGSTP